MSPLMSLVLETTIVVGFLGAGIALYGRYRILPAIFTGPNTCKLKDGGCQALFRTRNAALFGFPNSALALPYYLGLAAGLLLHWPLWMLLTAACAAFGMTLWLAWILVRDQLECRVCWTGHLCNTLIWLILLVDFLSHK
jgi:uncharacterized membrane protein